MSRILAVDPGTVRVGLAVSDPLGISAQPLDVIAASDAVERIREICLELDVEEIIVGLPISESGGEGSLAPQARKLADDLRRRTGLAVTTVDERYTSRMAEKTMAESGADSRTRRGKVDKVAAAVLLRGYLDRPEQPS